MAKRIAIVEDEAAIRENYAAAFRREGYLVDDYEARQPALEAFESRLPDLVVIDINLKDDVEGGFELCRDLRAQSRSLPIIFLTARDCDFDVISELRLGAEQGEHVLSQATGGDALGELVQNHSCRRQEAREEAHAEGDRVDEAVDQRVKTNAQCRDDTDPVLGLVRLLLADENSQEAVEEMQPEEAGERRGECDPYAHDHEQQHRAGHPQPDGDWIQAAE